MQFLQYLLTRCFVELFRLVPFWLLYRISDLLTWLFFRLGYREKVVYGNLRRCFPEKSAAEIRQIALDSYRNLADITLESIKGTTAPLSEINRRFVTRNAEIMNRHLDAGRSLIMVGGHFCNWEWGVITVAGAFRGHTIGVYKPLSNPHTDRWFFRSRARDGKMTLKSMKETFGAVEQYRGKPTVFILVGDQSPSNRKTAQWVQFFGRETACLPGVDLIARANDFGVFYFDIQRVRRGFYELTLHEICLDPTKSAETEITQRFMSFLETKIREKPGNWLWSHRRWKMERTGI